jgi:N-acyl-D-amino-acid deacylase
MLALWRVLLAAASCLLLGVWMTQAAPPSATPTERDGEILATGRANPDLAPFDQLMTSFLRRHRLPGGALAVAREGRIVYARGFGLANREREKPVRPRSLFRIASISKPLTAVAILQLVERGKLRLSDRVFDVLELRPPRSPGTSFDRRWRRVTILHLLHHTGGWDREKSFDPMFRSPAIVEDMGGEPPAMPDAIIRYMLRRPLDFEPGERYAYSNFGYCLLGRVIEKASGQGYEEYVRQEVLAPLGIKSMRLGKTLPRGRAPGEVRYHVNEGETAPAVMGPRLGKPVPLPYGAWCLEALDAHGGWIASAPDLVRFASAFDDPEHCPILGPRSIERMFARPEGLAGHHKDGKPRDAYYGCGWMVRPVGEGRRNTWHGGSLDGTSTLLVRRSDGLTWAVLFNSRSSAEKEEPAVAIDPLLHQAADAVKHWPGP